MALLDGDLDMFGYFGIIFWFWSFFLLFSRRFLLFLVATVFFCRPLLNESFGFGILIGCLEFWFLHGSGGLESADSMNERLPVDRLVSAKTI